MKILMQNGQAVTVNGSLLTYEGTGTGGSDGIISSIVDLKNTIVSLSAKTDANEKLMRAITSTYNTQPRMG